MAISKLKLKGVEIVETFAEAFPMVGTRVIITAPTREWALIAARTMTGFATSVIACGAEAGIERELKRDETMDGRPGVSVLLFAMETEKLQRQLRNRVGQCVLTSPGSACFAGLVGEKQLKLGSSLRFFGDGWQVSKVMGGRRFWRVPVMDGEFVCEEKTGLTKKAVGGGNLLVLGRSHAAVLAACERAVKAIGKVLDVITPFPGGIVRSGSKVGSKYKGQIASTNDAYCPTLKGAVNTALPLAVEAVMEIVIDGLTADAIAAAMRAGIFAIVDGGAKQGVTHVSAGNYGGNLGPHHFHLKEIIR
jgi:formylmethanofuran--tetrahydromethanopterin N-formyltransferase